MATIRNLDPRCDPESAKRLASGFWSHEYDPLNDMETWSCDKRKLHDALAKKLLDPVFRNEFGMNPKIMDRLWGEMTYEAYRHSTPNDRVCMKINPFMREDMAYLYQPGMWDNSTATTTNTITTTSGSTGGNYYWYEEAKRRLVRDILPEEPRIKPTGLKLGKRLVKNMPFVNGGDGLVKTLQREFDHWAGDQMKVLYGS